ncbi:beta-glucosidase [Rhodococcus triatomae]|uniref:Exo-alpha-(1->6)-L-arabinopyranosidase n=2 Tax=Rhodococcus triatomae TaxID=300028 RepID=A0A1G8BHG9_9NOCA|nr:beta-glucosidase [Rhodococcus triatomae]QNG22928.1 beta-glucosidase [Rhodococcus triatomae]SDH32676.1 beta-glucosidase [Rhodococcus triatomae]
MADMDAHDANRDDPARAALTGLTPAEKVSLTTGEKFWHTKGIARAGIPSVMLTDGPHGLRKQNEDGEGLGFGDSVAATCFPPAVALGCSFDPDLIEQVGRAVADEALAESVGVVLGPGINIKRSPLCGRNFEYYSEDPYVSGVAGAALVRGLQSRGVGASLKHFAANNQEHDRLRVSADIDPRPLREIYLRAFEHVVTTEQPWTVMASYNRINGVYSTENAWLLDAVLRREWGFEGLVVSDWFAVHDRVAGIAAGLDLEMPSSGGVGEERVLRALAEGHLDDDVVEEAAARVVTLARRAAANADPTATADHEAHHALARDVAARCVVLLKNDDSLLPLDRDASVAVIGEFARTPRYQGAGSSRIHPTRLDNALDEMRALAGEERVRFAPGFTLDREAVDDGAAATLLADAVDVAAAADVAVVFLGLPADAESEGFDRTHLHLPDAQLTVLDAVFAANHRTVVVLSHGGVVELTPFGSAVPAIVEAWLLGQAGGGAIADVLYGDVAPCGRLTETIPRRLEDTPAYLDFPGDSAHVRYGEGLFVGYRWYDAREQDVEYPFGHGLTYTTFDYTDLEVTVTETGLDVGVTVSNTGPRAGRAVVQVYTGLARSAVARPPRELKGFAGVELEAGQSRRVTVEVSRKDLAYWDIRSGGWVVESGTYTVEVGESSRDIRDRAQVQVIGEEPIVPATEESTLGELMHIPEVREVVLKFAEQAIGADAAGHLEQDRGTLEMLGSLPVGRLPAIPGIGFDAAAVRQLIELANRSRSGAS